MKAPGITAGLEGEEALTLSRLADLASRCHRTGTPVFSGFFSPRIVTLATQRLRGDFTLSAYGGYPDAERQMLAFCPPWANGADYPICAVRVTTGDGAALSHRDYLGAALGLGLSREAIGDIVVTNDTALYFCTPPACALLEQELTSVGRSPVKCTPVADVSALLVERQYEAADYSVSSLRLDCVVSAITGKARSESAALIEKGLVSLDYTPVTACARQVTDGAVLSVRGYGKAQIAHTGRLSKKGRIYITAKKYV